VANPGTRDYKTTRRPNPKLTRWQDFGLGLGIGLAVALFAYGYAHRDVLHPSPTPVAPPKPEVRKPPASEAPAASATRSPPITPSPRYDFYSMLPNFEVVVPEKERDVKRDLPTAKIDRPGAYVLQAGSYRNETDAQRIAAQLNRSGIDAKVQRVSVDNDVWHRVRIGPIKDLEQLNRLRRQLANADVDALVIRVGD
jgi:cell division protein FtsN